MRVRQAASDLRGVPPGAPARGVRAAPPPAPHASRPGGGSGRAQYAFIDYLELYFCALPEAGVPTPVAFALLAVWTLVLFAAIGGAADGFFAPAVAHISSHFKLPPDVAGSTLLAFGNGGADFFVQVAAITAGSQVDLSLAFGQGIGAGMYVCTVSLAISILVALSNRGTTNVPLSPFTFMRDVVAYVVAIMVAAAAMFDGEINIEESTFFVIWYLLYIVVVVRGKKWFDVQETTFYEGVVHSHSPRASLDGDRMDDDGGESGDAWAEGKELHKAGTVSKSPRSHVKRYSGTHSPLVAWMRDVSGWDHPEATRALLPITAPITVIQALTMPAVQGGRISRTHMTAMAFASPYFVLLASGSSPQVVLSG